MITGPLILMQGIQQVRACTMNQTIAPPDRHLERRTLMRMENYSYGTLDYPSVFDKPNHPDHIPFCMRKKIGSQNSSINV